MPHLAAATISRDTKEKVYIVVTVDADPTGANPYWAFTDPDTFTVTFSVTGAWHSDGYDAAQNRAIAVSPTIGTSGSEITLNPGVYRPWIQITIGSEVIVRAAPNLIAVV